MPPPCAVEAHVPCYLLLGLAASVNLHGASPWHPKPASSALLVATNVRLPPDKPGASTSSFLGLYRPAFCSAWCAPLKKRVSR